MSIQPRYLTLNELLENRLFRIPHYQRAYSWQRKQRTDMFNDISMLREDIHAKNSSKGRVHFMATVVGLRRGLPVEIVTDEFKIIEIVDGQQRLTTLVLLLKAIERQLNPLVATEKRVAQDLRDLLVKSDEASLILLQTNHDRSQYFANFLRDGTCPPVEEAGTHADRELLRAIHECEKFVSKWSDQIELTRIIKNHLTFIFHEIDDEASVYTVFEVLNNRGLAVAWLDRLKSMLMSVAFEDNQGNSSEHIDQLHDIWGKIYEKIGIQDKLAEEVLKFSGTLKSPLSVRTVQSEAKAVTHLRGLGENTVGAIEVSKWLLKVTEALDRFYRESRQFMTRIVHVRLLAVAISLRDFSSDKKRVLLAEWETTTFYIFSILRMDARADVGNYVKLAWNTLNNQELDADDISKRIKKIRGSRDVNALHYNLENTGCYWGWQEQLRYLLFRYEEYLAEQQGQKFSNEQWNRIWEASAAQSIEHIQPQGTLFVPDSRDLPEIGNVDRLGNLLLLPPKLNSALGNKKPEEKADAYIQTGLFMAQEVGWTIKKEGWCMKQVEEREQRIIQWIIREWIE